MGLLYILKEYQRRGIGSAFWQIAIQQVYLAMGGEVICKDEKQIKISCEVK